MAQRRATSERSRLDDVIARSKQITADLLTVRAEITRVLRGRQVDDARRGAADRLYLVLNQIDGSRDIVRDLWREAAGIRDLSPAPEDDYEVPQLESGQLRLMPGKRC